MLVLGDGKDPEGDRQLLPGHDGDDARVPLGSRCIEARYTGVRHRGAEELAVEHPREREVVGVAKLARDLGGRVDLPARGSYDVQAGLGHYSEPCRGVWRIVAAARSTAS